MRRLLRGAAVTVFCLAVLYISFNLGREVESVERARAALEDPDNIVEFFTCRDTADPEVLECSTVQVPAAEAPRVYRELLEELQEPSPKAEWDEDYREWKQAREGSDT